MRTYQCDACKKVIDNPHEAEMKEFYVGCEFDYCGVFPCFTKRKLKIDLCDDCFHGLHLIAEKALKERENK